MHNGRAITIQFTNLDNLMRARGCFFIDALLFPYTPSGAVIGQYAQDSCVAACYRMLLQDGGIELAEAYIRDALNLDQGSYLSETPILLRKFGLNVNYGYRDDLTLEELKQALLTSAAMFFVKASSSASAFGHALLVDEITGDLVSIRDPLPLGLGQAYRVRVADFASAWIRPKNRRGQAVAVVK